MMQGMERYGRNGDTRMAHVAPGEMVVPRQVLQQNPQVARGLGRAFKDVGADPLRYVVGSTNNSINPVTGKPEFFLEALLETVSNIASSDAGQAVLANVASSLIQGRKPTLKDALISGVVGGGLGALSSDQGIAGAFGFGDTDKVAAGAAQGAPISSISPKVRPDTLAKEISNTEPVASGYKDGLLGIGQLFGLEADSGIGNLLNTKAGEAIAMGLGSQLLSMFTDKDEETQLDRDYARRSRGYSEMVTDPNRVRLKPLERNQGGPAYFPRRNGGIMPSEGSGTKDDVPAMLTAGEFVMTRDAVKGAGNGSLNQGIEKMYGMMDSLERKA
tara:strand:+ start:7108 stop:8097 length:990 start_codon:yes stop_codon:yes gene_type:complete